jgi:hypothetical protein
MALPSLVGLRLGKRPEEEATDEWIRYNPDVHAGARDEALTGQHDCPISGQDFERGEWVWRAARREHGGDLNYEPNCYWRALQDKQGHDPNTTREVTEDAIRTLAAGPPNQREDGADGDDRDPRPIASEDEVNALLREQAAEGRRRAQGAAQRLREELRRRAYALIDQFGAENALNTLREAVNERNRQAEAARRREVLEAAVAPAERAAAAAVAAMAPPTRPWTLAASREARGVSVPAAELDALPPWVWPDSATGLSLVQLLSLIASEYPTWWLPQYVRDSMWLVEARAAENYQQLFWSRPVFRDTREQDNVLSVQWSSGPDPRSGIFTATLNVRADSHLGMVLFAAERSSSLLEMSVFLQNQIVQQLEGGSTDDFRSAARDEIREFIRTWSAREPEGQTLLQWTGGLTSMFSVTLHDDRLQPETNAAGERHGVRRIRIRCHQQFLRWLAIYANGSAGLVDGETLVAEAIRGRFSGLAENWGWGSGGLATLRQMLDGPPGIGAMRLERINEGPSSGVTSAFFLDGYRIMRDMMASVVGMLHGYHRYRGEALRAEHVTADHARIERRFGVYFPQFDPGREPRFRGPEVAPGFAGRQRVVATTRLWHALTQGARAAAEEARPASSIVFPQV